MSGSQHSPATQPLQVHQVQETSPSSPRSLCLFDHNSGLDFLVDSGADVSAFPMSALRASIPVETSSTSLQAANGTSIPTRGRATLKLRFQGLNTAHDFFLADIPRPILGADFFSKVDLLIDISNQRLLRCPPENSPLLAPLTPVPARATFLAGDICGLRSETSNVVEELLRHYPNIPL